MAYGNMISRTPWDKTVRDPNAPKDVILAAYRARVKATHPDAGGNAEEFKAVQKAAEELWVTS